uniref:Uncharacterized protein n=1 Tax=Tanacetum cinerariifolium TaxID=118510 RepID=A0A699GMI3_TANCI|nr:hypothetical protein [Tanacetum cinerariifolium]
MPPDACAFFTNTPAAVLSLVLPYPESSKARRIKLTHPFICNISIRSLTNRVSAVKEAFFRNAEAEEASFSNLQCLRDITNIIKGQCREHNTLTLLTPKVHDLCLIPFQTLWKL